MRMQFRTLFHSACLAGLACQAFGAVPPASFAVVELFTSEGCSSCPPADQVLSGLAGDADRYGTGVFALSFHVDYWNSLGWADPFSRASFSERQQRYARTLGDRVYTPQMIVNGTDAFVGSRGGRAREAVAAALERPAAVGIKLKAEDMPGGDLSIRFEASGHGDGDLLNVALVEKGLSVPVKRGENGGRTLKHENVVRAFRTVRLDARGTGLVTLEMGEGVRRGKSLIIAYVQEAESLRVRGAARAAFPP